MRYAKSLIGGGVAAIAAVLAGGWLLGVQPLLASATASEVELSSVQLLNRIQSDRLAELDAQGDGLAEIRETATDLETALPSDEAMADFLGELAGLETATGARIITLTTAPLTDFSATSASSTATPSAAAPTSEDGATAVTDSSAVTADTSVTPAVPGLKALPVSLSAVGGEQVVADFLAGLQGEGRYLSLSSIAFSTDPGTGAHRVDLVGTAYVMPAQS